MASVSLSMATTDGKLIPTNRAQLGSILEKGASQAEPPSHILDAYIVIDGMMLVQVIGKPIGAQTFGLD